MLFILFLIFFFFFYWFVVLRVLHSFPTRRSSDLAGREAARCRARRGRGDRRRELAPAITSTADRKSTRLNSSHVSISYAVFCLKKKKKNIPLAHYQIAYYHYHPHAMRHSLHDIVH